MFNSLFFTIRHYTKAVATQEFSKKPLRYTCQAGRANLRCSFGWSRTQPFSGTCAQLTQNKVKTNDSSAVAKHLGWGRPVSHNVLKSIKTEYHGVPPTNFDGDLIWIPIFRMPYLRICRAFIKVKLCLSIFSAYMCMTRFSSFLMNPDNGLILPTCLAALSLGGLTLAGQYSRKLICQIYVTEKCEYVRLTRLSFIANRIDLILPVTAILPLSENNVSWKRPMLKLKILKPEKIDLNYDIEEFYDETFNLSLRFGGVTDRERFDKTMGGILDIKV